MKKRIEQLEKEVKELREIISLLADELNIDITKDSGADNCRIMSEDQKKEKSSEEIVVPIASIISSLSYLKGIMVACVSEKRKLKGDRLQSVANLLQEAIDDLIET